MSKATRIIQDVAWIPVLETRSGESLIFPRFSIYLQWSKRMPFFRKEKERKESEIPRPSLQL
jgi:hypothetical protein